MTKLLVIIRNQFVTISAIVLTLLFCSYTPVQSILEPF